MTTEAAPLRMAPPCRGCAGGREVNGVTCRDCGGTGRQRGPVRIPGSWRRAARQWALVAAGPAGTVAGRLMRWSAALPGVAGAAGVTIGAAMIVHGVFHQVPGLGVAALTAGVFGLLADRQL